MPPFIVVVLYSRNGAVGAADAVGAVVGGDQHQRVVEAAQCLERVHQAAHVLVDVVDDRGVQRHESCMQPSRVRIEAVPRGNAGAVRRQFPRLPVQPHLRLSRDARRANGIPAGIVSSGVTLDVARLRMQRRMRRVVRQVEQERLVGRRGHVRLEPRDRRVGPIVGAVIVAGVRVVVEHRIVGDELRRREVMRFTADEAVEAIEAARKRPRRAIARGHELVVGRVVPFAHRVRRVAAGAQQFRERGRVACDLAGLVARIARQVEREPAAADRVRVLAGQKRRARRRAHGHRRVVGEAHATGRERIDARGADLGAVAAEVGEAEVVEQDHDDVRGPGRRA
jgi:hypothetical protein